MTLPASLTISLIIDFSSDVNCVFSGSGIGSGVVVGVGADVDVSVGAGIEVDVGIDVVAGLGVVVGSGEGEAFPVHDANNKERIINIDNMRNGTRRNFIISPLSTNT